MERTVTSYHYPDMLENFVLSQTEDNNAIFQQNGALYHYATTVCKHFNAYFLGWWIGGGGWKSLPPHFPDLTPLAFCLWGLCETSSDRMPPPTI
jgi:hypothetical protein